MRILNYQYYFLIVLVISCNNQGSNEVIDRYDDSSIKSRTFLKNGVKNGIHEEYFPDGSISLKSYYKNDTLNGLFQEYYENGQLISEVNIDEGLRQGKQVDYFKNGLISGVRFLLNDSAVYIKKYSKNGTIDWYQIGVEASMSLSSNSRNFWFRFPFSNVDSVRIYLAVSEIDRVGSRNKIYSNIYEDLSFKVEMPDRIWNSYDSLTFEIQELNKSDTVEITATIPAELIRKDTLYFYNTITVED